jgi:type VI secretion system protein ImpH
MASSDRPPSDPVEPPEDRRGPAELWAELLRACHGRDFFQAVRRVECLHPDRPRIGRSLRPSDDPVRLAQDPSLEFAGSTLSSFRPAHDGLPPRLAGHFFGLLGPNGPLPLHLTEYARERLHHESDPTFSRFLDVFHHRMLALFYRAWALNRPTVSYDRPPEDWFAVYLASLFGLGMPALRERDGMPDRAKLFYAGLFACQTRHPAGLQAIISDFFALPALVREFVGEWLMIPPAGRCRLGVSPDTGTLGETTVAGSWMWSARHKFRVVLGPLGLADFQRFLPMGASLPRLTAMVRGYAGDELAWDLNPVLKGAEVPPSRLGAFSRLGWTSWLTAGPLSRDADDLILEPLAYVA